MITFITHMRVSAHNAAAFEAAIAATVALVRENEPGVLHYALSRSADDPECYVVIEVYRDEAAFTAHWQTAYIRPALAQTTPLVEPGSLSTRRYEG